ncbi:MAG: PA0069 family radical SAM protein, partial [Planctomycetaceae bacterium]|nr:PA0069 family radical SAM protein [Planctomycetaceae bacterium]
RIDPPNRFLSQHVEADLEHVADDADYLHTLDGRPIEYLPDASQSIVSTNDSPDIPFNFSVNPYRGCAHGCPYCYARNTHEYLGLSAGLDFETKILVKHEAPRLLREFLARPSWRCESITFSGVTDCYQPAERQFRLTRGCLEVCLAARQPVSIITKNALITRDLDLLRTMAELNLVHVALSIPTLDAELARVMEPRTSTPAARLRALRELSSAGVPTLVMVAPIIPGLNDSEAPQILATVREAGAIDARFTLLRLPLTVEPVFREWLAREQPLKAEKIEALVRQTRAGKLNRSRFGQRMTGTGEIAEQIRAMFNVFRTKHGFTELPALDCSQFRVPTGPGDQLRLF